MASTRIKPTTQTTQANNLQAAISALQNAHDQLTKMYGILQSTASGGDWAAVQSDFGYPSAEMAESAHNLIVALFDPADPIINSAEVQAILDQMG